MASLRSICRCLERAQSLGFALGLRLLTLELFGLRRWDDCPAGNDELHPVADGHIQTRYFPPPEPSEGSRWWGWASWARTHSQAGARCALLHLTFCRAGEETDGEHPLAWIFDEHGLLENGFLLLGKGVDDLLDRFVDRIDEGTFKENDFADIYKESRHHEF